MECRGQRGHPKWYQDTTGTSSGHRRCSAQLQQSSNTTVPQQPPMHTTEIPDPPALTHLPLPMFTHVQTSHVHPHLKHPNYPQTHPITSLIHMLSHICNTTYSHSQNPTHPQTMSTCPHPQPTQFSSQCTLPTTHPQIHTQTPSPQRYTLTESDMHPSKPRTHSFPIPHPSCTPDHH